MQLVFPNIKRVLVSANTMPWVKEMFSSKFPDLVEYF
jgi:hypothetical protein